jgi:hypothetical protein
MVDSSGCKEGKLEADEYQYNNVDCRDERASFIFSFSNDHRESSILSFNASLRAISPRSLRRLLTDELLLHGREIALSCKYLFQA